MGGIDGYDWSVFGGNPAPGDPDATRAIATNLRDLADEVDAQNRLLQSVGSDSESIWVGPAASAFRPHVTKLPGQLAKLVSSYRDAADALDAYWPALASAQQTAVSAWHKAQAAQAQVQSAQAGVEGANQAARSAAAAYNHAATAAASAPPDPTGTTAAHVSSLQNAYQSASYRLSSANSALSAANAALSAAHTLADQARTQARTSAGQAANGLRGASNAGIHNPHHSWFSSIVDDVEGVVSGGVDWVEHHAEDIEFSASLALGPAGLLLTADGRHLLSTAAHDAQSALKVIAPGLKVISGVLGVTSAVLAVAGLVLAPLGVGEVIDVINEGVMGLKTADDGLLLASGDKAAEQYLVEDAIGLATGGVGRLLGDAGDTLGAAGEADEALSDTEEAGHAVDAAMSAVSDASGKAAMAGERAENSLVDADLLTNMAADANAEGRVFEANSLAAQASAKIDQAATAVADEQRAGEELGGAVSDFNGATDRLSNATEDLSAKNEAFEDAKTYNIDSVPGTLKSFGGANNLARLKVAANSNEQLFKVLSDQTGVSGNFGQRFVSYYAKQIVPAPNAFGFAGGMLHTARITLDLQEANADRAHLHEDVSLITSS